ncbi:MAG: hypothetical protein IJY14_01020 [Acholeplasmatales bacterium]|nr:hypothetical protein [Acholeplasmatales bacterium]
MKRLIIIFILIMALSSCQNKTDIYESLYIASMGIEKIEDEYQAHFLLPSSMDVGSNKSESNESDVAKIKADNLKDLIENIKDSSLLTINLKHISSFILHTSILNEKDLKVLIDLIKDSKDFDYNFYMFTTEENIEKIYKIKNPNQESIVYTMLVEPNESEFLLKNSKPVHFLNMCRDFLDNKEIRLPYIELASVWDENDSIRCEYNLIYHKNNFVLKKIKKG